MNLGELVEGLGVRVSGGEGGRTRICDLTEDSRSVFPGSLFIAKRGVQLDGRQFIDDAVRSGACAVLTDDEQVTLKSDVPLCVCDDIPATTAAIAERFYSSPGTQLASVGITGTNGKTTIAHLVHQMLNRAGVRCGLIGTVVIDDGREEALASMTTPPAIELSRTLATMVETGCRAVVMEVSSHALDQRRTDGVRFDAGVFTNLTPDHGDYHPTREAYLQAKRRLFSLLKPDGLGIVNCDDPAWEAFSADRLERCRSLGATDHEWSFTIDQAGLSGMSLRLIRGTTAIHATTALFGAFNAMNVLQAFLASREILRRLGSDDAASKLNRSLQNLQGPPGRLMRVSTEADDVDVFVDFAHTPDALRSILDAVQGAVSGTRRVCVVFGCGGDRDRDKRALMGAVAGEGADRVIVTSDNPRRESPSAIVAEILAGMPHIVRSRAEVHIDRAVAICTAIEDADLGDVIILAGKGHERVQILPDPAHPDRVVERRFDDGKHARDALARRREVRASMTS